MDSSGVMNKTLYMINASYENSSIMNSTITNIRSPASSTVTPITAFTAFAMLATCLGNGLIIFVYFRKKSLRTPFNAYIVNIAIAEFLLSITALPSSFVRNYFGQWPLDAVACSFYMYFSQILGTGVRYGHVLVTVNRIWAVSYPLNYRTAHTNRVARTVIGLTWVYLHVLSLPRIFLGRLRMGTAAHDPVCLENVPDMHGYNLVSEIIGFDVPELFIVLTFPYILFKLRQRQLLKRRTIVPVNKNSGSGVPSANTTTVTSLAQSKDTEILHLQNAAAVVPKAAEAEIDRAPERIRGTSRSQNIVLTYFVVGVIICWTPNHVYYLIVDLKEGYWDKTFATVMNVLQYTYSYINPVLCYLALKDLRQAIDAVILCR